MPVYSWIVDYSDWSEYILISPLIGSNFPAAFLILADFGDSNIFLKGFHMLALDNLKCFEQENLRFGKNIIFKMFFTIPDMSA